MPKPTTDSIRTLCRKRIAALCATTDDPIRFQDRITRVVEENLTSGRFQRFATGRSERQPVTLVNYIDSVIFHCSREHARIQGLENGGTTEWNRLRDFLFRRAVPMVQRFRSGPDILASARDFAQQTCLIIFDECYPFDVSFDAWATTILKNLILAHYTRSPDVLNRFHPPESLDEPRGTDAESRPTLGELVPDNLSLALFEKTESQIVLLDAIDHLRSPAQRKVILETFLEELDDAHIARHLGKSKQAVYSLRHRALARLKEILSPSEIFDSDRASLG
jgi:RNA polymerase sigma factor (sigma-70 family)